MPTKPNPQPTPQQTKPQVPSERPPFPENRRIREGTVEPPKR
jgi:hypothetical protein